ncbi:WD domain, G-beta repeat protein [Dictyocaulus viviparus]|uniref:WD domain, G-beta repeat protein n=1 Tax=Dictyocaulus viviparus TaxID=29172 RepID=A0A0D8Y1Q0_DICVI|nr:WD domain, G-beta repeat protein [Dictyocaulus viviparus]
MGHDAHFFLQMTTAVRRSIERSFEESHNFSTLTKVEEVKKARADYSQQTFTKLRKVALIHNGTRVIWSGYSEGRCLSLWKRSMDDADFVDPFEELRRMPLETDPYDICCLGAGLFCISFTNGGITMFNNVDDDFMKKEFTNVHGRGDARILCQLDSHNIISGSSNGSLVKVDIDSGKVTSIADGNSGVRSISMLSGGTLIATGHSVGQLLIWDCRAGLVEPSLVCVPSKRRLDAVTTIANHSAQTNLLSFGTDYGVVGFCDIRGASRDLVTNSFDAATSTITQVGFHPDCGDHLVCSSADGSLVHWDVSAVKTNSISSGKRQSPWLSETLSENVELDTLRAPVFGAVNSFAINNTTVVAAIDMCMLYSYENVSFPIGTSIRC